MPPSAPRVPLTVACQRLASPDEATVEFPWVRAPRRLEGASGLFGSGSTAKDGAPSVDLKTLHAKIGELTLENDFLSGALGKAGLLSAKR